MVILCNFYLKETHLTDIDLETVFEHVSYAWTPFSQGTWAKQGIAI